MKTVMGGTAAGVLLLPMLFVTGAEGEKAATYSDAAYGFSIQPPQFPKGTQGNAVRLVVLAAPEAGFASNVNVLVQHVTSTRDHYRAISLKQFEMLKMKVTSEKALTVSGKDALVFDCAGMQQGRELRFLTLAVIDTGRVFVVTCTASKQNFGKYEKEFRACLESFQIAP